MKKEILKTVFTFALSFLYSIIALSNVPSASIFNNNGFNFPFKLNDVSDTQISVPFGKNISGIDTNAFKYFKNGKTFQDGGWSSGNNVPDSSITKTMDITFECQVKMKLRQGFTGDKIIFFAPFIIDASNSKVEGKDLYWNKIIIKSSSNNGDLKLKIKPEDILSLIKISIDKRGYPYSEETFFMTTFRAGLKMGPIEVSSTESYRVFPNNNSPNLILINMLNNPAGTIKVSGVNINYRGELICLEKK